MSWCAAVHKFAVIPNRQYSRIIAAWLAAAEGLARDWLGSFGDELARFERIRVVLPAARDTAVFDLDRNARWRFLRRAQPLAAHA